MSDQNPYPGPQQRPEGSMPPPPAPQGWSQQASQQFPPHQPQQPKRSMGLWVGLGVGVVVILALVIALVVALGNKGTPVPTPATSSSSSSTAPSATKEPTKSPSTTTPPSSTSEIPANVYPQTLSDPAKNEYTSTFGSDANFVEKVKANQPGTALFSDALIVNSAKNFCYALDNDPSTSNVFIKFSGLAKAEGRDSESSGFVWGAGVSYYCPQNVDRVKAFLTTIVG